MLKLSSFISELVFILKNCCWSQSWGNYNDSSRNKFHQALLHSCTTHVGETTVSTWNKWNKSDLSQWKEFFTIRFLCSDFILLGIMTYYVSGGIKEIVYFRFHLISRFCSPSSRDINGGNSWGALKKSTFYSLRRNAVVDGKFLQTLFLAFLIFRKRKMRFHVQVNKNNLRIRSSSFEAARLSLGLPIHVDATTAVANISARRDK